LTGEPEFPPLINGIRVEAGGDPFDAACLAAAGGQAGAGDLYWSALQDSLWLALVVEPEVQADQAMDMLFAAMVAFGDSVGAIAPPEVGVTYIWPQTLLVNGARVGEVSIRMAPDTGPGAVPAWMVIALHAQITTAEGMPEPGLEKDRTTLWDEGCGGLTRTDFLESFIRHLKTWIHNWEMDGERPVREAWLARAARPGDTVAFELQGKRRSGAFLGLDEAGNMLAREDGSAVVANLVQNLRPDIFGKASS